jgi:hypothetical protein
MSRKMVVFLAAAALCLLALSATLAGKGIKAAPDSPTDVWSIPWWTVDNGGGTSQGGPFVLSGTAGQPDAGSSSGGSYIVKGGFWSGTFDYATFIPLVIR